ncbi:hypothetical protein Nepgr_005216 [Nepenthes gracilis]|uniref:Uncharacterized protein n=1 Tax=Nepenthes gracilis TaxID=150966 RepID=A0AAD3S368_NEPGR|nr:hypothetical protein Nepgr_005216 [Nepenthes gracilis]
MAARAPKEAQICKKDCSRLVQGKMGEGIGCEAFASGVGGFAAWEDAVTEMVFPSLCEERWMEAFGRHFVFGSRVNGRFSEDELVATAALLTLEC